MNAEATPIVARLAWPAGLVILTLALVPSSHARADELKMGDMVVLKSLDTPLKNGARVIVPGDRFRRYTIDQIEGAWVRLAPTDIGGWVEREAILPLDRADEFFSNALMHDPGNPLLYLMRGQVRYEQSEWDYALDDFNQARRL